MIVYNKETKKKTRQCNRTRKGWNTLIVPVQTCMSKFISPNCQAQPRLKLQKRLEKGQQTAPIPTTTSQSYLSLQLCYKAQKKKSLEHFQ